MILLSNKRTLFRYRLSCLLISVFLTVSPCLAAPTFVNQAVKLGQYTFEISIDSLLRLEVVTTSLRSPRIIHFHKDRMLIGSQSGAIYWADPPYEQAKILTMLDGYPHSVVVVEGMLYVARTNNVIAAPYSLEVESIPASKFQKIVDLPGGSGHSSRTLKVGPDNNLYLSLGIAGNCSDQFLDNSYPFTDQRGGVFRIENLHSQARLSPSHRDYATLSDLIGTLPQVRCMQAATVLTILVTKCHRNNLSECTKVLFMECRGISITELNSFAMTVSTQFRPQKSNSFLNPLHYFPLAVDPWM